MNAERRSWGFHAQLPLVVALMLKYLHPQLHVICSV
jgi:hypothetical protein